MLIPVLDFQLSATRDQTAVRLWICSSLFWIFTLFTVSSHAQQVPGPLNSLQPFRIRFQEESVMHRFSRVSPRQLYQQLVFCKIEDFFSRMPFKGYELYFNFCFFCGLFNCGGYLKSEGLKPFSINLVNFGSPLPER